MKLLRQLGLVSVALLLMTTLCWGGDVPYISALREGNTDEARRLFWKDMEDRNKYYGENSDFSISMQRLSFILLGSEVLKTEQYDFGIDLYTEALEKDFPDNVRSAILGYRGQFWEKKGQYDKAIADYSSADNFESLGWLMATCPESKYRDGKKAVEYAQKAIEKAEKEYASQFNILAAAYAEEGNFQEAIKTQEKAFALLIEAQEKTLAKQKNESEKEELKKKQEKSRTEYEERLESYKAGKPWRMEPPKTE